MKIVHASASHHAMLFAFVAQEVVNAFGPPGGKALRYAVEQYGKKRGQIMAQNVDPENDSANNVLLFDLFREWELFPGQQECLTSKEEGELSVTCLRCPWRTEWTASGMAEYGKYFCGYIESALFEGFGVRDGGLTANWLQGESNCQFVFKGEAYTRFNYEKYEAKKQLLNGRFAVSWEELLSFFFHELRSVVVSTFSNEGEAALSRALDRYELRFGTTARKLLLSDFRQFEQFDDTLVESPAMGTGIFPLQEISRMIETEILVVGGSGAAVSAAVVASEQGRDVLIISKGEIGNSGNLLLAGGGFSLDGYSARHELGYDADDSFTQDDLFDCLIKEGFYLNDQDLVQLYVEKGPAAVKQLLDWADRAHQKILFLRNGTWIASGKCFARALVQGVREHPSIRRLEDCVLLDLLTTNGCVTGALALSLMTGEIILVRAKAVILATGGFQPFHIHNTVSDVTGDGQAIACRAGAELVDMEFLLFMPTALDPPELRYSIYPFVFESNLPNLHYQFLDRDFCPLDIPFALETRFRGKKISKLVNSYLFSQAQMQEKTTDRGGLYLDYSANSFTVKRQSLSLFFDRFSQWHKRGYYNGESLDNVEQAILNDVPLEIIAACEYSMGGIQVDSMMRTSVTGLFAAGEVTGGTFGACRAGDGIVEMLVHGITAGEQASKYCSECKWLGELDLDQISELLIRYLRFFNNKGGISSLQLFNDIQSVCDEKFRILRNETGLKSALDQIKQFQLHLDEMCSLNCKEHIYNIEWLRALQCDNLLLCCKAGILAAIERRESRGFHFRSDFPKVDHNNYLLKYYSSFHDGILTVSRRKPRLTQNQVRFPKGTHASIMAYLTDPDLHYKR
ncbi:MAG: FAD-binding protein [Clostridiaceae bacterium]|nr:FAD-binding protein [Clostridiaceae bacterium]